MSDSNSTLPACPQCGSTSGHGSGCNPNFRTSPVYPDIKFISQTIEAWVSSLKDGAILKVLRTESGALALYDTKEGQLFWIKP